MTSTDEKATVSGYVTASTQRVKAVNGVEYAYRVARNVERVVADGRPFRERAGLSR